MLFMILPCGFVQANALNLGVLPMILPMIVVVVITFICDVVKFFQDC